MAIFTTTMYHFDRIAGLNQYIDSTFTTFLNTKALIIDLRFNPGGGRDLIQKIASYSIPKSNSPWIANVAYLRNDEKNVTHNSMSNDFSLHIIQINLTLCTGNP